MRFSSHFPLFFLFLPHISLLPLTLKQTPPQCSHIPLQSDCPNLGCEVQLRSHELQAVLLGIPEAAGYPCVLLKSCPEGTEACWYNFV